MEKDKSVSTPLANHFKLSTRQCLSTDKQKEEMDSVPYASVVESLMYAIVCTRQNIAHVVGIVSRFFFKSWQRTLEWCEVDSYVSLWHLWLIFLFFRSQLINILHLFNLKI